MESLSGKRLLERISRGDELLETSPSDLLDALMEDDSIDISGECILSDEELLGILERIQNGEEM